jgi:hypothetical protein
MQLPHDRGNISHSLRMLDKRGGVDIGRAPGGKAETVIITPAGHKEASTLNKLGNKE